MKSISFCISCRNRLWQLQQTLKNNLEQLNANQNICLVDYGSSDDLSKWIWDNFSNDIGEKKLIFFEVKNKIAWNLSKAKNLAHRISSSDFLFSLDADNNITKNDIEAIQNAAEHNNPCHQWSGSWPDGSHGRIGVPKKIFYQVGGYDESFLPMGGQDIDLLRRLNALKLQITKLPPPEVAAVQNSIEDKMAEFSLLKKNDDAKKNYDAINSFNLKFSQIKIAAEGPIRLGGFSSYLGLLNGNRVLIDGLNNIHKIKSA